MNGVSVVVISLLKVCMQTSRIPLTHSDNLVCSVLCASYYIFHYFLKHCMMLADMSTFLAASCVCFATLYEASRLAAACSHQQSATQLACDDAHGFLVVAWCLKLACVEM